MQIKNNLKFFCIPLSFEHPQILEMYTTPPLHTSNVSTYKKIIWLQCYKDASVQFVFVRMF